MGEKTPTTYKIELIELESLLRKKLGDHLIVTKYSTTSFLPNGENYGSTILKVDAIVKKNKDAPEEDLHFVAKMLPVTEFQRTVFDSPFTFRKEAFLYEGLIPSYQRLEREFGIEENQVFDILPEFFGARFSLQDDVDFDDNAVILLQNLKVLDYYTSERRTGYDLEHAKLAIIAMARFHALGMAMKCHKPDYFEILKTRSKCLEIKNEENFEDFTKFFKRIMREDPIMSEYYEYIDDAMNQETSKTWTAPPTEPWSTIVHMDLWINNIMFRDDPTTKRVVDVKFLDFQNYLFMSPLRELTFFVMVNLDAETTDNYFDELIDCYYENFINILKRMKCDVEPFGRDKFVERLKIDAYLEFPHCPFMIKIMTADVKENFQIDDMKDFTDFDDVNPLFIKRLRRTVKKFADKGWLGNEK